MTARRAARSRRTVRERRGAYAAATAPVVVDASIAVAWFTDEPDPERGRELLTSSTRLLAPDLMAMEAVNAWWKKQRRGLIDAREVEEATTNLLALDVEWAPSAAMLKAVARLAMELDHPVYDCVYLALAASRGAALASADERLRQGARRAGVPLWSAGRARHQ